MALITGVAARAFYEFARIADAFAFFAVFAICAFDAIAGVLWYFDAFATVANLAFFALKFGARGRFACTVFAL